MPENIPLVTAMAEHCWEMIDAFDKPGFDQPASLRSKHLKWMCEQIIEHASAWDPTKTHRWIGFIQGAMIANQMIDLAEAKAMFDKAKHDHGETDDDLLDHLDPLKSFELEIGGRG